MKLASKTAIVTGAARGIGFGIAQVLAREGARVIIADRDAHGEAAAASLRESPRVMPARRKTSASAWRFWRPMARAISMVK